MGWFEDLGEYIFLLSSNQIINNLYYILNLLLDQKYEVKSTYILVGQPK